MLRIIAVFLARNEDVEDKEYLLPKTVNINLGAKLNMEVTAYVLGRRS